MTFKKIAVAIIGLAMMGGFHRSVNGRALPPLQKLMTTSAQESRSVWDGVFTEEQTKRGGGFYRQSCANCHGDGLEGADTSPALVGGAFTSNWNGLTLADLFERIRISMPADRPGTMGRQQIADILAFILSSNEFPAGETELPREVQALKQIVFKASKP